MTTTKSLTKQQLIEDNTQLRNTLKSVKRTIAVSIAVNDKMLADIDRALATEQEATP